MTRSTLMVMKRNGSLVPYDGAKIEAAVSKAFQATKIPLPQRYDFNRLMMNIAADMEAENQRKYCRVRRIFMSVEKVLSESGYYAVAKAYIIYRIQHQNIREVASSIIDYSNLVNGYLNRLDWRVKENSTVSYTLGGLILSNSGAVTANYWLNNIYDNEIADAHKNCLMHIHDLSMLSAYCAGWSLRQLLKEGIRGVAGRISSKPAAHLSTLCNQMVNFIGIMQNEWQVPKHFQASIRIWPRL